MKILNNLKNVKKLSSNEIDLISTDAYGTPFLAFLIQYYNDISEETLPEDTILKMFSLDDLNALYYNLSSQQTR